MLVALCGAPANASEPEGVSRFPSFKFWIREDGDEFCKLGGTFYIGRLHNFITGHVSPKFDYHIDGKPEGAAVIVEIEGLALSPERCYWRVASRIVAHDEAGYQVADRNTEYYNLGPSRSFGSLTNNDVIDKIKAQIGFFSSLWSLPERK
jgi:hypothetical protein